MNCSCEGCSDDYKVALARLEKRDEANMRIINEMNAKISNLVNVVLTEQAAIKQQLLKIQSTLQSTQPTDTTTANIKKR